MLAFSVCASALLSGCGSTDPTVPDYPEAISRIRMLYPPEAASNSIEGWVQVMYTVTEEGTATDLRVVDQEPLDTTVFHEPCLNAIATARFEPQVPPFVGAQYVCQFLMRN